MDWEGTYNDPIYGGSINVCVTQLGSSFVGQGVFSEVGYMRGTIDNSTMLWTGNFYSAGEEVKQGTFSLTFDAGTSSFGGSFTEKPGITYSVNSSQTSSVTPADVSCFRTDAAYLESTPPEASFTGTYFVGYDSVNYVDPTQSLVSGSYLYYYDDGTAAPGELSHTVLYENGQVTAGNWYEGTTAMGIEIWVLKNDTAFYESWWYCPRMADFDYSLVNSVDDHAIGIALKRGAATETQSQINSCYILPWETEETSCLGSSSSSSSTDSNMNGLSIAAITLFSLFLVFANGMFFWYYSSKKAPLSFSTDSDVELQGKV